MKKIWKIVALIVLVVILLGAVCAGVGMIAGGDTARIYSVFSDQFNPEEIYNIFGTVSETGLNAVG